MPINDIHTKYPAEFKCADGHFVRSKSEMLIDNWFYQKGIIHAYEISVFLPKNPNKDMYCDFYLPKYNTYIEFFGREGDKTYERRMKEKIQLYEQNDLNLWCLDNEDMKRFDIELAKDLSFIENTTKDDTPFTLSRDKSFAYINSSPDRSYAGY